MEEAMGAVGTVTSYLGKAVHLHVVLDDIAHLPGGDSLISVMASIGDSYANQTRFLDVLSAVTTNKVPLRFLCYPPWYSIMAT